MFRKIITAIPVIFASGILATSPAGAGSHPCREAAVRGLATVGLSPQDLRSVQWTERLGAGLSGDGEGWVTGYSLWTKPKACSEGYLVVDLTRNCHLRQVYARDGCRIEGGARF